MNNLEFEGKNSIEDLNQQAPMTIDFFIDELSNKIRNSGIEEQLRSNEPGQVGGIKIYLNRIIDEMFTKNDE